MENLNKNQLLTYGGLALMVLGLLLPVISATIPFIGNKGVSLLLNMGEIFEMSTLAGLVAILCIVATAYVAYLIFVKKSCIRSAAYINAGIFVILLIAYFVACGKAEEFSSLIKIGFGTFLFLIAGVCFWLVKEDCAVDATKE